MKQTEEDIIPAVNTHAVLLKFDLDQKFRNWRMPKGNQKWSPAACHSKKNNKEAKLIERKVCFILDADPKANSYPDN